MIFSSPSPATTVIKLLLIFSLSLLKCSDATVFINEIAPSATDGDWVELFNSGNSSVNLSGFRISDSDDLELTDKSFVLPADTQIAANAFLVLRFLAADTAPPLPALSTTLFRLSSEGETLTLATADGQLVDRVTFGNDADNLVDGSIGRKMDGGDLWCVFARASQGTANSDATPGEVVGVRDPDWHQDSHSKKKNLPLYDDVFDTASLQKLVLEFESEQWQICWDSMVALAGAFGTGRMGGGGGMTRPNNTMMPMMNNTMMMMMMGGGASDILGGEATYVQVTVRYRGRVWRRVGFRWKGNSSLQASWSGGYFKLPFRLDFDKFEDDFPAIKNQRFYGFGKMTFGSNFGDGTGMRELVMQTAYANMDVAAARGSLVQVFMDRGDGVQTKVGIYTMIEDPGDDNGLPRRLFNDDGNGNVYKPDGNGGRFTTPLQTSTIELKAGGVVDANFTDVLAVAAAAHASTRRTAAAEWRANFERVFDVDDFVRWAIVTRAYGSWDQYGQFLPHNYYLYCNLTATPCTWIAWDGNFVLGSSIGGGGGGGNLPMFNMSNMGMLPANFTLPDGVRPMRGNMSFPGGGNMSFPGGGGGGGGGGGMSGGALNLADTAEGSWPLLAFVRDDPVFFEKYREAARRLLTSSNSLIGNLTMLDEFIDHWDSIIGAELALETFPFATLANGTANTYKADVDKLRSTVAMYRTLLVAFVGNDTAAVGATDTTSSSSSAGGSTVATSSANDMSMSATTLLAMMVQIIVSICM
jgi:hypothetical protein